MQVNHLLSSHFGNCRLLATARDDCRNRDVRLYAIPGEFDYVGVTDGTDSWVSPTSINPFSVNIQRLLADLRAGKALEPVAFPTRRRINLDGDRRQIERRAIAAAEATPVRRRLPSLTGRTESKPEIQELPRSSRRVLNRA